MYKWRIRDALHSEVMGLALVLWLCSLPLVGFLVLPFFGLKTAVVVAVGLFILTMVVCWGICGGRMVRD